MPETDVNKMKVADLKRELKLRGLPVNGNKNELADRLQTALLEGSLSLEDSAITDALDGDDDVLLTDEDEHKLLLDDHEDELLKSPVSTSADLLHLGTDKSEAETPSTAKKIVLKRTNSQLVTSAVTTLTGTAVTTSKENAAPEAKPSVEASADDTKTEEPSTKTKHQPIVSGRSITSSGDTNKKLSELSIQERMDLRAKKFGITPAAAATPAAAVNKSSSASIMSNKGNKETDEEQKEALKRRAERFGCVIPEKTSKAAADERLQKRKERFGVINETSGDAASKVTSNNYSEKARARLERFKTAPAGPTATTTTTTAAVAVAAAAAAE